MHWRSSPHTGPSFLRPKALDSLTTHSVLGTGTLNDPLYIYNSFILIQVVGLLKQIYILNSD